MFNYKYKLVYIYIYIAIGIVNLANLRIMVNLMKILAFLC